jgi:CRP-like cAMP-binding protein
VEKGLLRSYTVDDKGSEHILQFASEGWWVADLSSYLSEEPSFLNIEALEDAELLMISKADWEAAMKKIPALEHYFRIILQNHLIATQKRLLQSLAETAEEKYNRFLKTYPECVQRMPQHMIASYLGVTRETLSRVRKQLLERS